MFSRRLQNILLESRSSTAIAIFLLAGSAILSVVTILVFGTEPSGDTARYINRGGKVWDFLLGGHSNHDIANPWNFLYLLPNLYVSALIQWASVHAKTLSIIGNILIYNTFIIYLFRTWVDTKPLNTYLLLVAVSLFMFYGLPGEVTKYLGLYHSSDILFLSLCGVTLGTVARSELQDKTTLAVAALLLGLLCLITRPPGIVTFLVVLSAVSLRSIYLSRLFIAFAFVLPVIIALVVWPYYMDHLVSSRSAVSEGMSYVIDNYKNGSVVSGYKRTYVQKPSGFADYAYITLLRVGYYLIPLRASYSFHHMLLNLCYLAGIGYFFIRGCKHLWRLGPSGHRLLVTIGLYLLWMTLFHAMTQVEDWRYEMPLWAALWLVAGYGLPTPKITTSAEGPTTPFRTT